MDLRILLAEDEVTLLDAIKLNLEMEGYEVVTARNGLEALRKFETQRFNLAILDVMMPETNGFEVCRQIRLRDSELPVLFLTAKDSGQDRVTGLKAGADDYLTKPFNLEELLLRVKVLIRHSLKGTKSEHELKVFRFGGNSIDFTTYEAIGTEGKVQLTKKEVMLLKLLIDRQNEVVSRNDILQQVWGYDVYPSTRTIDNFILAFRKYFEKDPKNPQYFYSIRGVGYKFNNPS